MNKSNWLCVVALAACGFTWLHRGEVGAQVNQRTAGRYQLVPVTPRGACMVDSATGELWWVGATINTDFEVIGHIAKPKVE